MKNNLLKSMLIIAFVALTSLTYAQTDVIINVVDESKSLGDIATKGAWDGWATLVDMTMTEGATSNTYTATVQVTDDGDYEWGAIMKDGSDDGIWLPPLGGFSSNPKFTNTAGTITGDLTITIPVVTPVDVTLSVDMSFEISSKGGFDVATDTVGVAGTMNGWGYTKMTKGATDSIYSVTIQAGNALKYKFRKKDEWEGSPDRWTYVAGPDAQVVDPVWYSNISPAPIVSIKCYVIDGTEYQTELLYKGEITGWSSVPMFDDGTNGDETAGDHKWTVTLDNVAAGASYEWGITDGDDNWLIVGSNVVVEVGADGAVVSGDTYTIAAWGTVPVIFSVDMNCHINLGVFLVGDSCLDVNIDGYPPVEMAHIGEGVYEATITRFSVDDVIAYTYRIGCAFGGDYEEYPGADANRTYTVVDGANETGVELFQDDVLTAPCDYVGVENLQADKIQVYPNPAGYEVRVSSEFRMQSIDVFNITGQKVMSREINEFSSYLNVESLKQGIYMISVNGVKGERAFTKVVKN